MPEETTIQTASTDTSTAAGSTSTQTTVTKDTAATGAANTGATSVQTEESIPKSRVEQMIKDRLKNSHEFRETVEALQEAGYLPKDMSLADVRAQLKAKQTETAHTKANAGDITDYARLTARNEATSATMDVRIDIAAERLAERDPLFADLADSQVLAEIRPLARILGGDVKQAYLAKYGDKFTERQRAQIEARMTADFAAKANKGVESADGGEGSELGLTTEELRFARARGVDPKEYAALKHIDNLGDYEKAFKRK